MKGKGVWGERDQQLNGGILPYVFAVATRPTVVWLTKHTTISRVICNVRLIIDHRVLRPKSRLHFSPILRWGTHAKIHKGITGVPKLAEDNLRVNMTNAIRVVSQYEFP